MRLRQLFILLACALLAGCSTTKNTGVTRTYHGMKVIHNVYFNGRIAYEEGMQAIDKANEDDFSEVLPLYPISNPKAQQAGASQMDKSIEKCRKCIKLHSIHAKPKRNSRKMSDPQYRAWLQRKEFNNQMYRAWMMLGQSEFHKGDFLGSVGTFSYISRLYDYDKDIVAQCQLWTARAYAEMGWIYEAEDMLKRVQPDNLKRKNQPFYSAVSADIMLKGGHYREAVPFVQIARKDEKRKGLRPRFEFVLGQLYQIEGQRDAARAAYKRVMRLQPAHELMFNSTLRYHELAGDTLKTMRSLRRMAKLDKNKDLLDQIYGTMGNLYLNNGDTARAVAMYELAAENSTRSGSAKAAVLLQAADLHYSRREYEAASPCYKEAVQIISSDDERYPLAANRAETLDLLVQDLATIRLQDSLQVLSKLPEDEQLAAAERVVEQLIAQEKADSVKAAEAARAEELVRGPASVNTDALFGGPKDNSWYFYNANLLKKGRQDFRQKWGNRALEDNWRRMSKSGAATASAELPVEQQADETAENEAVAAADSVAAAEPVTDVHNPEYYLQQIPKTEADLAASDSLIADALCDLVYLYKEKIGEQQLSDEAFEELVRRFPQDKRLPDLYYMQYLNALRNEDGRAEDYRRELMRRFPDSRQAQIVADPDYFKSLQATAIAQDSLYAAAYTAYKRGDYKTVKADKLYAEQNYPLSQLMPRFLFLNAVATARTEGQPAFVASLQDMVERYPEHELSAMAKNMLAMMGEGMQSKKGGAMGTLQDKREQKEEGDEEKEADKQFSAERQESSYVLIIMPADAEQLNNMMYEVALFNFSQFLIKDFDIQSVANFSAHESALQLSGFDSLDEAEWYISLLEKDVNMSMLLKQSGAQVVAITAPNYRLLGERSIDDYKLFMQQKPGQQDVQKQKPAAKKKQGQTKKQPKKKK